MKEIERLLEIIGTLRGDNGCSWDRAQTVLSMNDDLIEETYEVIEAIEKRNMEDLQEEIGDLIFLSLFVGFIAEQEGHFELREAIGGVCDKLIRRHPHVFGEDREDNHDNILINWERIKREEKKNQNRKTPFDGIPEKLPELQKFNKILEKMKRNQMVIPESGDAILRESFDKYITNSSPDNNEAFFMHLFIHSYFKGIDLPALTRSLCRKLTQS